MEDMFEELEALRAENERLKRGYEQPSVETQPAVLAYTHRVFYTINGTHYLDEPRWEPADIDSVVLHANNPIRNINFYLDQHPEIAFAIYKDYSTKPPAGRKEIETVDGTLKAPKPVSEVLSLIAPDMFEAMAEFVGLVPNFDENFPSFNLGRYIRAPYLFMYYSLPFVPEVVPKLDTSSRTLVTQLVNTLEKSHGYEYRSARQQAEKGKVARHLIRYLIRPGDVLVGTSFAYDQAFVATEWNESEETSIEDEEDEDPELLRTRSTRLPRYGAHANSSERRTTKSYSWEIPVWYWVFNGVFQKTRELLKLTMSVGYDEEFIDIQKLTYFPLQYAEPGARERLQKRGRTFWSIRHKKFVSYLRSADEELNNVMFHSVQ